MTSGVLDAFQSYEWPGNVRELENCIQQMVAINSGPVLHENDLPSPLQNHRAFERRGLAFAAAASAQIPRMPAASATSVHTANEFRPSIVPLMELERQAIYHALEFTNGDRGTAANLLGIGRTTLYRKLKEYGVAV
jgi:two-component system response regulator HydG